VNVASEVRRTLSGVFDAADFIGECEHFVDRCPASAENSWSVGPTAQQLSGTPDELDEFVLRNVRS